MAHAERHVYTRSIPAGAKRLHRADGEYVQWIGRTGRPVVGKVCQDDPKRCMVSTGRYYAVWTDHRGVRQRTAGSHDERTTERLAGELQDEADARRLGVRTVGRAHAAAPLAQHLDDYRKHLEGKRDSADHVAKTIQRVATLLAGCQANLPGDLDADAVAAWINDRLTAGAVDIPQAETTEHQAYTLCRPFGVATANGYLRAVRSFARWMFRFHRMPMNPLSQLSLLNADVDVRRERRTISDDQFAALIRSTRCSTVRHFGLDGADRAMLYITAAWTGLRASELASLTRASLDLDAASIQLEAVAAKAKHRVHLPIGAGLLEQLRTWLANKPADGPAALWPGEWSGHGAAMLKADLEATSPTPIVYQEGGLFFDFHALRHQFTAMLETAGIDLKERQKLLRHSTPVLTANVYHRLRLAGDVKAAADRLPDPPATAAQEQARRTASI